LFVSEDNHVKTYGVANAKAIYEMKIMSDDVDDLW
jgi:hypothetical protein